MKQHITPKQAKEVTKEQFYSLIPGMVDRKDWGRYHCNKITIGKMLEILKRMEAPLVVKLIFNETDTECEPFENLCDNLWDAVKICLEEKI